MTGKASLKLGGGLNQCYIHVDAQPSNDKDVEIEPVNLDNPQPKNRDTIRMTSLLGSMEAAIQVSSVGSNKR